MFHGIYFPNSNEPGWTGDGAGLPCTVDAPSILGTTFDLTVQGPDGDYTVTGAIYSSQPLPGHFTAAPSNDWPPAFDQGTAAPAPADPAPTDEG